VKSKPNANGQRLVSLARIEFILAGLVMVTAISLGSGFAQEKPKSLYQRLGGYDVIAGIIDDFLAQMRSAPEFARFSGGRSRDSATRARQLVIDQLCAMSGGPCTYIGRDMRTAHAGLKITDAEWELMMKKYKNALDKFQIAEPEQRDFLAMIEQLRPTIVETPKEEKTKTQN
jgi:hemoglobin